MYKIIVYLSISLLIIGCSFVNIFPYPIFSKYTNLTESNQEEINNYYETEITVDYSQEISVLNLDWFELVNKLFPIYKDTKVIDIYSGLTYYVQRNGGTNHADVEPINKTNAEIFKEIYGGVWSWDRRPVWVEINDGIWVAGSINGYPHGKSYIYDGINGHTCIHFLNSKTHGTKKVDSAHQNCVNYAFKHGNDLIYYQ